MKDKEPTEELVVVDISRYKKIKNALKDSEVRYRSLFENMPIGIFRFSADGKILDANPALQKILGYAASAELERKNPGKNDKNLLKILSEFCAKIESQNEFRSFDLTWRKKDNTPLSIRVNARMVSAGANNVLFYEGTVEDISERKQAEEALARQNDALSKLNQFSIELSMLSSADNLEAFITKRIKEFTGAVAAIFSEYNPESRTTTPQHIEMEPRLLGKVVGLLSKQVERIHSVVSDEMYREITTEIIGIRKTLHEASFGAVSRPAGAAIQALLKVDRFIGVAYLIDGELYGTSLLAMRKGQPDLPKEILENFSFLAAVSLKRKQAESQREAALEALRESEEKFRSIFNNIVDLYYQTDMQGLITNLSPSCFVLSGWKPEELIGCQVLDFYTDRKQRKALLKKLLREDAVSDYEITLLHRDGKHIAVSVSSHLIRNEQGNPKYVEGIIRDISERKRAESQREAALEALEKSSQLLRATGEMAKVGGWELDLTTQEVSWTEEIARIHGVEPGYKPKLEEALNFYAPESRPALEAALKKAAETGEPYDLESLFIPQGSKDRIWVRALGKAVYSGGKIVKLAGTFQNIDKYKRAEAALQVSHEKYRVLFESFPLGISISDKSGKIIEGNRQAEELLGITREAHAQRRIDSKEWQIIRKDGTPMPAAEYASTRALRENRLIENIEMGIVKDKGEITWISVTAAPIPLEGYGVAITYGDITERKQAESQREAALEALHAALAGKEVLLKEVHHRVKNNLAAIIGLLQLQREMVTDPAAVAQFIELEGRIRSMALVHETLYGSESLARIELQDFLEALIAKLRAALALGRDVRIDVSATGVEMGLDCAIPCGLILNELLTNAFKYAFPGGQPRAGEKTCAITITAAWDGNAGDNGVYTLTVADNGVGLPVDLDWAKTKTLGLRLVRMLGEYQLKGRIELDRSQGTSFRLVFASRQREKG